MFFFSYTSGEQLVMWGLNKTNCSMFHDAAGHLLQSLRTIFVFSFKPKPYSATLHSKNEP